MQRRKIGRDRLRVGERIREARKGRGMTIEELARKTRLSKGFISKAERSLHTPSLSTLQKIAQALDVPLNYFFLDLQSGVTVVKKNKEVVIQNPGSPLRHKFLSPGVFGGTVLVVDILPGQSSGKEAFAHEGFESNVVTKGKLKFYVGGAEYALNEGDAINLNSSLRHGYKNTGEETATLLTCNFFPSSARELGFFHYPESKQ